MNAHLGLLIILTGCLTFIIRYMFCSARQILWVRDGGKHGYFDSKGC